VAFSSRVQMDQRAISRVATRFNCHFTYEGVRREAVAINLSIRGAFLSSKFLPPVGSQISVSFKLPELKETMNLDAKVVRGGSGTSDHGAISRFAIRFTYAPSQLITLIPKIKEPRRK